MKSSPIAGACLDSERMLETGRQTSHGGSESTHFSLEETEAKELEGTYFSLK